MKYVLDSSSALCWVLPRPDTPMALRLRWEYQSQIHERIAPSIFPAEVAGTLTKSERQKIIAVGQAPLLLADILSTPPLSNPTSRSCYGPRTSPPRPASR
jgi:hypothetical protein